MSNIEENIKRCEQLTEARHANWIGISNQLAIAHIVDRVKELERENEELLEVKISASAANTITNLQKKINEENNRCAKYAVENNDLKEKLSNSISKQKVKNKIEEYDKKMTEDKGNPNWVVADRIVMNVLQELLEEK